MGYGCRHNNSIVIERQDLDGICNVFKRRITECERQEDVFYYCGALDVLSIIRNHEFRDQSEFFAILDALAEVNNGNDN